MNIVNRVSRVTISDGAGATKSRQDITYDETGYINTSCPTGAAQHIDTAYGCTFTTRGNPTSVTVYTDPVTPSGGFTKHFAYDSLGNLLTADVDCCQREQWNYSVGTQYAFPDSVVRGPSSGPQLTTSFTYDSNTGLLTKTTDENSQTTSLAYDVLKRLGMVTRPDNAQIPYTYTDALPPAQSSLTVAVPVQGVDARTVLTTYDGLGRPIHATTSGNSTIAPSTVDTQYDPLGRPYKVSNPYTSTAQYWTETRLDGLGRATMVIPPDGSATANRTTYSYSGTAVTVTDPAGKQRKSQLDGLGRLLAVFEPDVSSGNALTQQTSYTYTALDALASITQGVGVQTRTFNYDALSRLTSATTPEGGTVSFQYGSLASNFTLVTQRTDARGVATNYTYDGLNRLTQVSYNVGSSGVPATPTVGFTYGTSAAQFNNGRLVTMTDGVGSEGYTYNNLGEVTQLQKVISGTTYTTSYAYNLADELTSLTYPSGRVVNQSYDVIGRLTTIASGTTNYASGFAYNPAFQVTNFNYANGVAATFGYSSDRLQLTSLSYAKGASTLYSLNYWYKQDPTNCTAGATGNNGQIQCITDNVDSGRTVSYTYDALYRLSTAITNGSTAYPKWGLSFTYDRYGNRTAQSVTAGSGPSNSVTIDVTKNRITGTPYSYDANGNMTNDGLNSLTYDAENRAVSAAGATYSYDGNGLRVKKVSGSTTTVYIFSGTKVTAEYVNGAAPASPTREYIYAGSQLIAKIEAGATNYYHADHLSVRFTTDGSATKIGDQGHYPFGESWYASSTTTKWQFTSYERDTESVNDYAMFRYDVNRLGRFSSPDPLAGSTANPQSLDRYGYVLNGPVNRVDPLGLQCRRKVDDCEGNRGEGDRFGNGFGFVTRDEFDLLAIPVDAGSFTATIVIMTSYTLDPPQMQTYMLGVGLIGAVGVTLVQEVTVPYEYSSLALLALLRQAPVPTAPGGRTSGRGGSSPRGPARVADRSEVLLPPKAKAILGQAGQIAAPVADPRFILLLYGSQVVGALSPEIVAGLSATSLALAALSPNATQAALQALEGASSPQPPRSILGAVGYALSQWLTGP